MRQDSQSQNRVNIAELKKHASEFPDPLRTLLMEEPDYLTVQDFITKFGVWERVLQLKEAKMQ